jgi:hypothetical protein
MPAPRTARQCGFDGCRRTIAAGNVSCGVDHARAATSAPARASVPPWALLGDHAGADPMAQQMTTQDRHDDEGRLALEMHGPCPHGRPQGVSNYDVAFCGSCEREAGEEAEHEAFLERLDARFAAGEGYPYPIGPVRRGRMDEDTRVLVLGKERPEPPDPDMPF